MIIVTRMIKDQNKRTAILYSFVHRIGQKLAAIVWLLIASSMLSSCSTYSTSFNCPDSKGARCSMLSEVDMMIDSGEIETVYLDKKCKKGKCQELANIPKKSLQQPYKVKIGNIEDETEDVIEEGDNLYLK